MLFISRPYLGEERVLVFTNPSILSEDDEFQIRIRVLSNASNIRGTLKWRNIGNKEYKEIPLSHMARNVFEVETPVSTFGEDFEYYIEMEADDNSLVFPATAGQINQSVVLF